MKVSVVVPVYNEENRIYPFIADLDRYTKTIADMEVIFVNDGSSDGTIDILKKYAAHHRNTRIVSYSKNRGKGYAVKQGVAAATGEKIIFIDADNATRPNEITKMADLLDKFDVVVGDRTHPKSYVAQPSLRQATGKLFNFYANTLFGINVRDNLCGFKGFNRAAAKQLFRGMVSDRWIFDIELFYKIRKSGMSLGHMPIKWEHKEGTKIKFLDPFRMFFQLLFLRIKLIRRNKH